MILKLAKQTFETVLLVSAPMLGAGLIVGVVISILQIVTSIHDTALAFVPSVVARAGNTARLDRKLKCSSKTPEAGGVAAVARVAGLLGIAIVGVAVSGSTDQLNLHGFHMAMLVTALLVGAGGAIGAIGIANPRAEH